MDFYFINIYNLVYIDIILIFVLVITIKTYTAMEKVNEVFKIWKKDYEINVILLNKKSVVNEEFFYAFCELSSQQQKEVMVLINNYKEKRNKELLMISLN